MKVLEFKLDLTLKQQATIDRWLTDLKYVWNRGLSLLEEEQQRLWRTKNDHLIDEDKSFWEFYRNQDGSFGLCCPIARYDKKLNILVPCVPIRSHWYLSEKQVKFMSSCTNVANPDKPWLHLICSRARYAMLDDLFLAWKAYKKGTHRKPKYKSKNDKLTSFRNNSSSITCIFKKNRIKIPILGWLKAIHLSKRWQDNFKLNQYRIVKNPSGYYIQLTTESLKFNYRKITDKAVGLDVGLVRLYTKSNGQYSESRKYLKRQKKRIKRLQRRISKQEKGSN